MFYQRLNQMILLPRVKSCFLLGVNLCRALSSESPRQCRRLSSPVTLSFLRYLTRHNPLRVINSATHWSDLSNADLWLVDITPSHLCIWRNPSMHIFCRLNALNPAMIPGWEMTECGCHKISENDTKYPETCHDTCRCHDTGQDHEQWV